MDNIAFYLGILGFSAITGLGIAVVLSVITYVINEIFTILRKL